VSTERTRLAIRALLVVLLCLLAVLQVRLWVGEDGFAEVSRLKERVASQQEENQRLAERNQRLEAEVNDLKQGFAALEERARADLGLITPDESFYVIGEPVAGDAAAQTRPTAE
jgi:cell division protein FtsB